MDLIVVLLRFPSFDRCLFAQLLLFRFRPAPELFSLDHIYDHGKAASDITIIVYGEVGSPEWLELHKKAVELAEAGKAQYVLRHYMAVRTLPLFSRSFLCVSSLLFLGEGSRDG